MHMASFSGYMSERQRSPRILLLDHDPWLSETLPRLLKENIPQDLTVEYCVSQRHVLRSLSTDPCHALICSPYLVLTQETSLLTRSRSAQPPVPFILTLEKHESEYAADWLDWGAYDFIMKPIDNVQVVESISGALELYKWRTLIANKEKALQRLRRRRDLYRERSAGTQLGHDVGRLLDTSISRIEEARDSLVKSSERVFVSLQLLKDRCIKNELQARQRAVQRLPLSKDHPSPPAIS